MEPTDRLRSWATGDPAGPFGRVPRPEDVYLRSHKGGHAHGSGGGSSREIHLHRDLLAANDRHAEGIRSLLRTHRVFSANLMSSPGSGKTALLEATLATAGTTLRLAIIEGDIETSADADRLAPFGIQVIQVNTAPFGGDCHLAAPLVAGAVQRLDLHGLDVLIVENVGNLVCPAEFDIGEDAKVVLLSVTEGEDKPLKYPLMFHEATLALITKIDLLPYLDVDLDLIRANIRRVNPTLPVLALSSRTGEGMEGWLSWLETGVATKAADPPPATLGTPPESPATGESGGNDATS
ncbi:MAG: hydrogenase nickel incorporation protein HypB [Thermoleophilia bacterium]